MALQFKIYPVTEFQQNCSLVWCDKTLQAALVDPGGDIPYLLEQVKAEGVNLAAIWLTHGHIDHVGGVPELKAATGLKVWGPEKSETFWLAQLPAQSLRFGFPTCPVFTPDTWLEEGDTLSLGEETLQIFHIPGHTPGHVVFYHQDSGLLIAGDVLFRNSVGRTDFPMGSHDDLISNIKSKLLVLPEDTQVIPGHGRMTTIGLEKNSNPFLR